MPGGRPSKYTPEMIAKAAEYIDVWETLGDAIPSNMALQQYLGISNACLYDWGNDDSKVEFSDTLEEINRLQHRILLNKGLTNEYNATIVKLALANHGHSEKTEQKMSGAVGVVDLTTVTDEELKKIIRGE